MPAVDVARLGKYLGRCPRGRFVTAHARFHPCLSELVAELRFRHILLLRDPRDVAVSHSFYMLRDVQHQHHEYYARKLKSDGECLMASLRGFQVGAENYLPPIGESFARTCPGRSIIPRWWSVSRIWQAGRRGRREATRGDRTHRTLCGSVAEPGGSVADRTEDVRQGSLTFRKGQTGDWRHHFGEVHKRAFKETAGEILISLGYENDQNW